MQVPGATATDHADRALSATTWENWLRQQLLASGIELVCDGAARSERLGKSDGLGWKGKWRCERCERLAGDGFGDDRAEPTRRLAGLGSCSRADCVPSLRGIPLVALAVLGTRR